MKSILTLLLLLATLFAAAQQTKQDSLLFDQAAALLSGGKYDEALTIVNRLISNRKNAEYFDLRGEIYMRKDIADTALFNFNAALMLDPQNPYIYSHRASVFLSFQMPDEGIEDYNQAIKLIKGNDTLKYSMIGNRGSARQMKRDFQGAYEDFKTALTFDSVNIQALISMGSILDDLGKPREGITYLEKAVRLSANEVSAIGNLGFRYIDFGEYKKAIAMFNRVLELSPNDGVAYNNRGYVKYKMNDLKGALKDIELSIKYYPANSYAFRNSALIHLAMKQQDKACEDLQHAIELGFTPMYGNEVQELLEKHCLLKTK
ncbi:tetratricopeptide repeat protein [Chitinophaga filiformis]|uniref:tetratricopeptide repeat protein n=1 Tax=Chitinophaga filiformis TaxID=104663 RepID=UPI001F3A7D7A|nr:tetratricopeptide repeat protein [Chitinophaga filiformis]MCF6405124.1 tetratricopeptide repeat protein [Chitinophaga filiformis]